MKKIIFPLFLLLILCSCVNKNKDEIKQQKIRANKQLDSLVCTSLRNNLVLAINPKELRFSNDSILKYYALNESIEDENSRKLFPSSTADDSLLSQYIDILIKGTKTRNAYSNYKALISLDVLTVRNCELGEGLIEVIHDFWKEPTCDFIKALAELSERDCIMLYQTLSESQDTLDVILGKVNKLGQANKISNYQHVIKLLKMQYK